MALNEQAALKRSRSAKSKIFPAVSSQSTGPTFPATETFANSPQSDLLPMELPLMPYAGDSPVNDLAMLQEGGIMLRTYGLNMPGSAAKFAQATLLPRTSSDGQSSELQSTSGAWGCRVSRSIYQQMISGRTMSEAVGGLLHTPTRTANFKAPSMQKWPSCARYETAFGERRLTGPLFAFLMGFPPDWAEV